MTQIQVREIISGNDEASLFISQMKALQKCLQSQSLKSHSQRLQKVLDVDKENGANEHANANKGSEEEEKLFPQIAHDLRLMRKEMVINHRDGCPRFLEVHQLITSAPWELCCPVFGVEGENCMQNINMAHLAHTDSSLNPKTMNLLFQFIFHE